MNNVVAEWCGNHLKRPTKILYLPGGPHQIGKCEAGHYDVIITRCQLGDLDNKDLMASLWRLGYEFAAADGALLLEIKSTAEERDKIDIYGKMSNIGWCRWDSVDSVSIFYRVQRLAPWLSSMTVREMQPNLVVAEAG